MAWTEDYPYRLQFVIDHSKIDENLTNFPVKIKLDSRHNHIFDVLRYNPKKICIVSNDTKCYAQIEYWNLRYRTATIHVKIPFISSNEDTIIYIYYKRQFESAYILENEWQTLPYMWERVEASYDFTSNGKDLSTDKWLPSNIVYINDNKLRTSITSIAQSSTCKSKFILYGDFDIQVDFERIVSGTLATSTIGLMVGDIDTKKYAIYYDCPGTQWQYQMIQYDGTWTSYTGTIQNHTSGKLRLVRVSNNIYGYYWNGTTWVLVPSGNPLPLKAYNELSVYLAINSGSPNFPALTIDFSAFKINSCQKIKNYYQEENQLIAYDLEILNKVNLNRSFEGYEGARPKDWTITEGTNSSGFSNKLRQISSTSENWNTIRSDFVLHGNFDVQVDYNLVSYVPASNGAYCIFSLEGLIDNKNWNIAYHNQSGSWTMYAYDNSRITGTVNSGSTTITMNPGKFRFTRVGNVINHYYWNGTTWVLISLSGVTSDYPLNIRCSTVSGAPGYPTVTTDYSVLIINYSDAVTMQDAPYLPSQNVWDSNFECVLHMNLPEIEANAIGVYDSTVNKYCGTPNVDLAGLSGQGISGSQTFFYGTHISNDGWFSIFDYMTSGGTLEICFCSFDSSNRTIFSANYGLSTNNNKLYIVHNGDNLEITVGTSIISTTPISIGQYYYVVITFVSGKATIFINDVEVLHDTSFVYGLTPSGTKYLCLGAMKISSSNPLSSTYFIGNICEFRISNTSRSNGWIKSTYYSLFDELFSVSGELENSFNKYSNKFNIKVDNTKIDEDLNNFPLSISPANISGYNANDKIDIFNKLESTEKYDPYTVFQIHTYGDISNLKNKITLYNNMTLNSNVNINGSGSYYFEATNNNYIIIDEFNELNFNRNDFTIESFIYPISNSVNQYLFWRGSDTLDFNIFINTSGYIVVYFEGVSVLTSSSTVTWSTWQHIEICRSNSTLFIRKNGNNIGSTTNYSNISPNGNLYIGSLEGTTTPFNGYMRQIRISNICRNIVNFSVQTTLFTNDIYTILLLQPEGDKSKISSSITFNGTYVIDSKNSPFESSYYFNGTNNYISVPDNDVWNFGEDNFTISVQLYLPVIPVGLATVICHDKNGQTGQRNWALQFNGNVLIFSGYTIGDSKIIDLTASLTFETGKWYKICVIRNSSDAFIYINGLQYAHTTVIGSLNVSCSENLMIGAVRNQSDSIISHLNVSCSEINISKGISRNSTFIASKTKLKDPVITDVLILNTVGDQSSFDHTPTISGVTTTTGNFEGSYYFNGIDNYISFPDSSCWDIISSNFTVQLWAKFDDLNAHTFISQVQDTSNKWQFNYTGSYLRLYTRLAGTETSYQVAVSGITIGNWNHYALTRQGNTLYFFVNGVLVGKVSCTSTASINGLLYVGRMTSNTGTFINYMKGNVEDLIITKGIALWVGNFSIPISPYIKNSVNRQKIAVTEKDIYKYYDVLRVFTTPDEYSFSKNDLIFEGSTSIVNVSDNSAMNAAYSFNGSTDYIIMDSDNFYPAEFDFEIDFFVKLNSLSNQTFLSKYDSYAPTSFRIEYETDDGFNCTIQDSSIPYDFYICHGSSSYSIDTWYHIAVSRHDNVLRLFVNGIMVDSTPIDVYITDLDMLTIGAKYDYEEEEPTSDFTNGLISNIRISFEKFDFVTNFSPPTSKYIENYKDILLLQPTGDKSGKNQIIFNNTVYVSSGEGKFGSGLFLENNAEYITVPNSSYFELSTLNFSLDLHFQLFGHISDNKLYIISHGTDENNCWSLSIFPTDHPTYPKKLVYIWRQSSTDIITLTSVIDIEVDIFYHVAIIRNGSTFTMKFKGITRSTQTSSASFSSYTYPITIGEFFIPTLTSFNGILSNIRLTVGVSRWASSFSIPNSEVYDDVEEYQLPAEIENWEFSDKKSTIWAKIPVVSSLYTNELKLYYDLNQTNNIGYISPSLESIDPSDTFTGNNGDLPDQTKWIVSGRYPVIQNNAAQFIANASILYSMLTTSYRIYGNFEVVMYFEWDKVLNGASDGNGNGVYWWAIDENNTTYGLAGLTFSYPPTDSMSYWKYDNGIMTSWVSTSYENSKYFRITRTNGIFTYGVSSNGSTWLTISASTPSFSSVKIRFYIDSGNNKPEITANVDYYTVTYADGIGYSPVENIWDDNFKGVYHLNTDILRNSTIKDSTKNLFDASTYSLTSSLEGQRIGRGILFNGINDKISFLTKVTTTGAKTIEILFYTESQEIGSLICNAANDLDNGLIIYSYESGNPKVYSHISGASPARYTLSVTNTNYKNLIYLAHTWDGTISENQVVNYINGILNSVTTSISTETSTPTDNLTIGGNTDNTNFFNGIIYEIRISNISRSPAWLKATYYSLIDELIKVGSSWKHVINSNDLILRKVGTINNIELKNIKTFYNFTR